MESGDEKIGGGVIKQVRKRLDKNRRTKNLKSKSKVLSEQINELVNKVKEKINKQDNDTLVQLNLGTSASTLWKNLPKIPKLKEKSRVSPKVVEIPRGGEEQMINVKEGGGNNNNKREILNVNQGLTTSNYHLANYMKPVIQKPLPYVVVGSLEELNNPFIYPPPPPVGPWNLNVQQDRWDWSWGGGQNHQSFGWMYGRDNERGYQEISQDQVYPGRHWGPADSRRFSKDGKTCEKSTSKRSSRKYRREEVWDAWEDNATY